MQLSTSHSPPPHFLPHFKPFFALLFPALEPLPTPPPSPPTSSFRLPFRKGQKIWSRLLLPLEWPVNTSLLHLQDSHASPLRLQAVRPSDQDTLGLGVQVSIDTLSPTCNTTRYRSQTFVTKAKDSHPVGFPSHACLV